MLRRNLFAVLASPFVRAQSVRDLRNFLDPRHGAACLLDVRSKEIIASIGSADALMPPGSTLKPMVLAALLESHKLSASTAWPCPIQLAIDGRQFDCSHPRLAQAIRAEEALAYSCNCFVARAAERFAPEELGRELRSYGFHVSANSPKQQLQALGEANVLASVADLARAYRQLAMRLKSPELAPILAGMEGAVEFGTGQAARIEGVKIAGKTGSASVSPGRHAAWFAGLMPSRAPEVVVAVMLAGRSGGADAAPLAREILLAYRSGQL